MRTLLSGILLLLVATTAYAALPPGLAESLRPADGIVIKSGNGECLIDLGTLVGAREGDLVAVLESGEEVTHPVTGATLGHIDRARTFLRIVRVRPDFSWAKQLDSAAVIHPTEPVRRLAEAPAVFIDQRGDGHPFFNELQQALPHLAWRSWGERKLNGPGLIFTLSGQSLTVHDDTGTLVDSWAVAPVPSSTPAQLAAALPMTAAPAIAVATTAPAKTLQRISPKLMGKAIGVAIADFDGDGSLEGAIAIDQRVEVGRFKGMQWLPAAGFELVDAVKALTIDAFDIDRDGRAELLVTAVRNDRLSSQVWGCDGSACRLLAKDIPWHLRVVDFPGEGRVVLAQEFDSFDRLEYVGKPFRVLWQNGRLQEGAEVDTFVASTLHGSQPLPADNGTLWAWLTDSDKLSVLDETGRKLWQGKEVYGGGEAFIQRKAKRPREEDRRIFIRSRLGHDGGLLLVPQNQGMRTLANWRMAETSRLVALRWNDLRLEEAWSTPLHDGYLADFAVADIDGDGQPEYLLVGAFAAESALDEAQSALFLWKNR